MFDQLTNLTWVTALGQYRFKPIWPEQVQDHFGPVLFRFRLFVGISPRFCWCASVQDLWVPLDRPSPGPPFPEKPQRTSWVVHGFEPRPQFHETTPKREKKQKFGAEDGKTKLEILGLPRPLGPKPSAPTLWALTFYRFGPFWPPPFRPPAPLVYVFLSCGGWSGLERHWPQTDRPKQVWPEQVNVDWPKAVWPHKWLPPWQANFSAPY